MNINIREIVLDILLELEKKGGYVNILTADVLDKYDYLSIQEKAFIKRVAQGSVERRIQLDYVIDRVSNIQVKKMKPLIRNLMRMSVYQLMFMDAVPDCAVCNEAVKIAVKRKFGSLKGYVNGVLRKLAKETEGKTVEELIAPEVDRESVYYLSLIYSMPEWLTEHFIESCGRENAKKVLTSFLENRPLTLHIEENLTEEKRQELIRKWESRGISVKPHPYLDYAVEIGKTDGIKHLPGYGEGLFMVQDISSMLVAEASGIKEGQTVIDVCAAPGGKAIHMADKTGKNGKVLAFDISENKIRRLKDNCQRMKKENVKAAVMDATVENEDLIALADVVIADVPCSGLGVICKKQDIKYNVTVQSMEEITELQRNILKNVANYVKPGGVLMYSTCTINPKENEKMVEWFCDVFPYKPEAMDEYLPKPLKKAGECGMVQLLPGVHPSDGFFFAKLRRNKD